MAEADWTVANDVLATSALDRGATSGITSPPGGGSFIYGFNSLGAVTGSAALFFNGASFAPMASGGSIQGVVKRGVSGAKTGWSPFMFLALQGPSINDIAYLIGLSDADPSRIVVRKGALNAGIPDSDDDGNVLMVSDATFDWDEWFHLRMEAIVNTGGDVIINVFRSDLDANPLGSSPDFQPIAGMANPFVDDALGINSGSQPLVSGRAGYGAAIFGASSRRSFFDHIAIERQT